MCAYCEQTYIQNIGNEYHMIYPFMEFISHMQKKIINLMANQNINRLCEPSCIMYHGSICSIYLQSIMENVCHVFSGLC